MFSSITILRPEIRKEFPPIFICYHLLSCVFVQSQFWHRKSLCFRCSSHRIGSGKIIFGDFIFVPGAITDIIVDRIEGGEKGQHVYSETRRILDRLLSIDLHEIEKACNNTANSYRDKWSAKNPMDRMIEENLSNLTYEEGIKELSPPFMLTRPHNIHIGIQNSIDISNPKGCANVMTARENPLNLILNIFLAALELSGPEIMWTNFTTSFRSVIIHEFLHLCGEIPELRQGIVDGCIRHTKVGTEAIEPFLDG